MPAPLSLLLVDDEPLARARLRALLGDLAEVSPNRVAGEAESGAAALAWLMAAAPGAKVDVLLVDIHMPGMDGLELAAHLGRLPEPPGVIFTTAYEQHAVQAFELDAIDYLLKPVRAERLKAALDKARQRRPLPAPERLQRLGQELRGGGRRHLPCHERGRLLLVPVDEVLYFKADLKYVTARTRTREYVLDETLTGLEAEYPHFLRLHRGVLVARPALAGLERAADDDEAYGWALLRDVPEKLPVSRRHWSALREGLRRQALTDGD